MLTTAQIELRRTGITATDIVTLAGFNPYATPLDVYEQKLGAPPKDMTLAMEMGDAAEAVVVRAVAKQYKLTVAPGETTRHNIFDWVLATPDRFVVDAKGMREAIIECKLVGWRQVGEWYARVAGDDDDDGEPDESAMLVFPDSVAVQTTWQMGCTGQPFGYIGALLGGWAEDDFHHATIELNRELWIGLVELAERFWVDHVKARVPPTPDGSENARRALERIYPRIKKRELAPASTDAAKLAIVYIEEGRLEKEHAERKRAAGNQLRAMIGDGAGFRGDTWKAEWIERKGKVSVDRLQEALQLSNQQLELCRGPSGRSLSIRPLSKKDLKANAA